MKSVTKIFIVTVLSLSLLQAAAFEKTANSKTTKVMMSSDKPLTTGNNIIKLNIENLKYKDAQVRVKVFMPAMPGMPAMQSISDAKNLGKGNYKVKVNLSMGGTWQMHIFITPKNGKKVRVKSSVNI